jgi:glycine reductase
MKARVVHYLNQFFAGLGGEDAAGSPPGDRAGPLGPGRLLSTLLAPEAAVVATVHCGDDLAAGDDGALVRIIELVTAHRPDVVALGPAFSSGRFGLACVRVARALSDRGIRCVAAMHPSNPGVDEAAGLTVIGCGESARDMKDSMERLARAVRAVIAGEELSEEHGRIGPLARVTVVAERPAAQRAVDTALALLAGNTGLSEIPPPEFGAVEAASPLDDPAGATIALLTEGGLCPVGNPDRLPSARAQIWLRYPLGDRAGLDPGEFMSVHGGFSTVWANEDPNRIVPLDEARRLEEQGVIGRLYGEVFVTTGNGTAVASARRFGSEWARELHNAGVQAAILTAT